MNIINIEESAFEMMMAEFDELHQRVEQLCSNADEKRLGDWLDATAVCFLLNIKTRQLQHYRDSGKISFSKIGRVIMYHRDDVMKLLNKAA